MAGCVICLEQSQPVTRCRRGHAICSPCFTSYVQEICSAAASTEINSLPATERQRFGRVHCPCAGAAGGCDTAAFSDTAVASSLTDEATLARYLEMRALLPIHEATTKVYEEANATLQEELVRLRASAGSALPADPGQLLLAKMLRRNMPNARQCKQCGWGPMAFKACSDLQAHHGQVVATLVASENEADERVVKIDNSCPRCGWFARERKAWPKWDGVIHDDVLPNQWEASSLAARQWYPKVAAAEKREKEAIARAQEAEERMYAAEASAAREREARFAAERDYRNIRGAIGSSERACADASRRIASQLERERMLRRKFEAELRGRERPPSPPWSPDDITTDAFKTPRRSTLTSIERLPGERPSAALPHINRRR
jgi:hypothetical protein